VVSNNAGANKLDYYVEQDWDYEVWLDRDGGAFGRATVRLTNTSPTTGRDQTVLGPNVDFLRAGENLLYVSTYCAPACGLSSFSFDGAPSTVAAEREFDMAVFPTTVQLASGEAKELTFEWRQEQAWDGRAYRLVVPAQPVMRPVRLRAAVHPPRGRTFDSHTSSGAGGDEGSIIWEGELGRRTVLEFHLQQQGMGRSLFGEQRTSVR
jgi:hypothetical protein